jgi:large subunit ribosomal protein L21
MYAVIKTGGKQYRVSTGDVVQVEKLDGGVGDQIELSDVLLIAGEGDPKIGRPNVEDARVTAEIVKQGRAKKIIVFKKKRRKGYKRTAGHRQSITTLRISEIHG